MAEQNKENARMLIQGILDYPAMIVPQLEDKELLLVIDDALHFYQENEMPPAVLTNFAETVQLFMGFRQGNLGGLLEEIQMLPKKNPTGRSSNQ